MVHVLVVGYAPDAVDFTDPLVPKGMNKEKVAQGIEADKRKLADAGFTANHLNIRVEDDVSAVVLAELQASRYDCVIVGGGVRATMKHVDVLEAVVNAIREGAPDAAIGFNNGPDTSAEAAARVLRL